MTKRKEAKRQKSKKRFSGSQAVLGNPTRRKLISAQAQLGPHGHSQVQLGNEDEKDNVERILLGKFTKVNDVSFNVDQSYVIITEDKLRLCLIDIKKKIERNDAWIAPLGILITMVLSFLTTDFKDFGFKASTWQAVFIIITILTLLWLIFTFVRHSKFETIDEIINKIRTPR